MSNRYYEHGSFQDRKPNVFPLCRTWTQRPVAELFDDPTDPYCQAHFYALFHSLLGLPPINCDNEEDLQRANQSPTERLELWQRGPRFDLVYYLHSQRKFRLFIHKKQLYRPGPRFPDPQGDRSFPLLDDEDCMNQNSLCGFLRKKIKDKTAW